MNDRANANPVDPRLFVTLDPGPSLAAESMRTLRTHVMARHVQPGHRALAVCAPSQGVGCTFVASNLAVALSQIGVNTLLIDANMRRPMVADVFGITEMKNDLRTALASDYNINDCLVRAVLPQLSVLPAGGRASNAHELIASSRFKFLMDFCLREFDATILDTPPANKYSDARRIGSVAGYCLVVAQRNKSLLSDVKALVQDLQGDRANVIGTVLTES
jgi:capsular exopolysaccharide synthesis family protein